MLLAALPDYDFLPAPLWLIVILHVLTLTLHFLAMNFLLGGLVLTVFGGIEDKWHNPTVRTYLKLLPTAMAASVTIGVAPLLFAQLLYGGPIYSASIISGWFWLLIPFVVIVGYYFLYGSAMTKEVGPKVKTWLFVTFLALIYVSVVYSSVFSMAERPELQKELYAGEQGGFAFNSDVGSWILRWAHMITGAITVGAFFFGWIGRNDEKAFPVAKRWFLYAFVVTSVAGTVYLVTLGDLMGPFMRSPGIWAITVGVFFGLGGLHFFFRKKFWMAGLANLLSVLGMVVGRHVLRDLSLAGQYDVTAWRIEPQWGVFGLFLVCFLAAIGLCVYMVRLFFKDQAGGASRV